MNKVTRFGVSIEEGLISEFDRLIKKKGYTNRSEALRDIIREKLISEHIGSTSGIVFGSITFIYDHHQRMLEKNLNNIQHDFHHYIIATTHAHVSHDECLEVVIVKGEANKLRELSDRLLSLKGVNHGTLTLTSSTKGHR
jgi:CopG family nickel-responsive transcriptional regulator